MYMYLGTMPHSVDSDQARLYITTNYSQPTRHDPIKNCDHDCSCLSHAFFLGVIEETYNKDSAISIYLKEILFYLHLFNLSDYPYPVHIHH